MEQTEDHRRRDVSIWEGRDELNLAEFPIACLSSRPDKSLKTLQFEDRIWDRSRKALDETATDDFRIGSVRIADRAGRRSDLGADSVDARNGV